MKDKRVYWIWLANACGAGSRCAVRLCGHFGDAESIYKAKEKQFKASEVKIDKKVLARLLDKDLTYATEILNWCNTMGVDVLCPGYGGYPKNLTCLTDAPMVLYSLGEVPDFTEIFCCAIVGTRKMTEYGKKCAVNFGYNLARCGALVVSGIARGIDSAAMTAALDAGGKAVAVLGCGIDIVYPKENEDLMRRVAKNGCILTEYAPGTSPYGPNFPVRNRLISALSQAVLVVEGNMRSGALITARHAFYQNKDIFAVPGHIDDHSSDGTNSLIKGGVQAVTDPLEIVEKYEYLYPHLLEARKVSDNIPDNYELPVKEKKQKVDKKPFAETEKNEKEKEEKLKVQAKAVDFESLSEIDMKVYRTMKPDVPMLPDELVTADVAISQVMVSLTMLELAGAVEAGAGGYFVRHADDEEVGEPSVNEFDEGF